MFIELNSLIGGLTLENLQFSLSNNTENMILVEHKKDEYNVLEAKIKIFTCEDEFYEYVMNYLPYTEVELFSPTKENGNIELTILFNFNDGKCISSVISNIKPDIYRKLIFKIKNI